MDLEEGPMTGADRNRDEHLFSRTGDLPIVSTVARDRILRELTDKSRCRTQLEELNDSVTTPR